MKYAGFWAIPIQMIVNGITIFGVWYTQDKSPATGFGKVQLYVSTFELIVYCMFLFEVISCLCIYTCMNCGRGPLDRPKRSRRRRLQGRLLDRNCAA